jgi:hypothetical protein
MLHGVSRPQPFWQPEIELLLKEPIPSPHRQPTKSEIFMPGAGPRKK